MSQVTILVDGDILRYRFAFKNQDDFNFGDTGSGQELDPDQALRDVDHFIESCAKVCTANRVVVCLTDDNDNWRNAIYPEYKANRDRGARPVLHSEISRHLNIEYETFERPSLEADDVMGILSTSPYIIEGEKVIVSLDKDMETIPGLLYNPDTDQSPRLIRPDQADYKHLEQALTGDQVDNYPGCPGVGPKKAQEILQDPHIITPRYKTISRGPNKGEERRVGWDKEPTDDVWKAIVSYFENYAGLTENDALVQARVARILRRDDYDFENRSVNLWNPIELKRE